MGASFPSKRNLFLPISVAVWSVMVVAGIGMVWRYALGPGRPAAQIPNELPAGIRASSPSQNATLVVFLHPRCPCSRATVGELAALMAHTQGRLEAHVYFIQPRKFDAAWVESGLWRDAAAIPGVLVSNDPDGGMARRFGARTSGQAILYDRAGEFVFAGGITSARGHAGNNAGREAVVEYVLRGKKAAGATPVFGCSLF